MLRLLFMSKIAFRGEGKQGENCGFYTGKFPYENNPWFCTFVKIIST